MNASTNLKKAYYLLQIILSIIPWCSIILFYSYVIRVSFSIGRIVEYDNPQSGDFQTHFKLVNICFEFVFYSVLFYLILLLVRRFNKETIHKSWMKFWLIGITIILIQGIIDPFGFAKWYVD
jgi:hypothetical protein